MNAINIKHNIYSLKIYNCFLNKVLQCAANSGIIITVECGKCCTDCRRYALKRKVAGGVPANFRGVCPILNRAIEIANTVCG